MMKKIAQIVRLLTVLLISFCNLTFLNIAFAEDGKQYIFSAQANSVWVLNKTTRKMMFLKFEKQDKVWKSDSFQIPATYNIDHCAFQIVGRRGQAVLVFDTSSGAAEVYEVKSNHTIETYISVGQLEIEKGYAVSSKGKHAWILNRSAGNIRLVRFEGENKAKATLPAYIPLGFDLDKCEVKSVGKHGEGVIVFDPSSGKTAFYKVQRKGEGGLSVKHYGDAATEQDLQ